MLVFAIERCEPAIKYTYIPSLLGFPPTHPGHYRETGWVPCAISSYYATSVELIPLHCKPLISTIMTIDRFASILFFVFFFLLLFLALIPSQDFPWHIVMDQVSNTAFLRLYSSFTSLVLTTTLDWIMHLFSIWKW